MKSIGLSLICAGFILAPMSESYADSTIYNCLDGFYNNFSADYENNNYSRHVEDFEIEKRRQGRQNVIVANLIDPVDDKPKKLFVTKQGAKVCDPSADEGSRCKEPEERHLNASIGRHISVLPDVYKISLREYVDSQDINAVDAAPATGPEEIMNNLDECKRLSKTIRKRIMMKARAVSSVYDDTFNIESSEAISEVAKPQQSQPPRQQAKATQ